VKHRHGRRISIPPRYGTNNVNLTTDKDGFRMISIPPRYGTNMNWEKDFL